MTAATTPQTDRWNVFAIIAFVTVWFTVILGLIFGHLALSQIKKSGEKGRGLALAAVIIGWIAVALGALTAMFFLIFGGLAISANT
ncbi:hypothetical protein GCM10017608_19230 [Agromyces luteolus]|uniref:DUF4190 domain-containing protein n=1 Tax=Agromyces luteolus TaxID=88373 RepID=A0A7C9MIJ6_9MICO|nr:DUF4190 domain-containing protein [Agromyces luteolus]MUN07998.1 DUF4190 domain-containing protein [Agromyces luteolus]GLK27989.1 hypothetical protein GCM10017608_19230 [Agromyces luteolus]